MYILVIILCKIISFLSKLIGRGSSLPGVIAYKLNSNIFSKFKMPKYVIAVTGSSGKTSTSYMIYKVLKNNGLKVYHNSKGSNLLGGVLTLIINSSNIFGKINADALVIEVDERFTQMIFEKIKPTHIVLLNITRDQPPRQGNYKSVYKIIKDSINKEATLIVNADDPIVTTLSKEFDNEKVYFGICKCKDSFDDLESFALDMVYCPKCNTKLKYNYVSFSNLGDYYCPKCDFKRPNLDFEITSVTDEITINDKYNIKVKYDMLYLYYNLLASFTCCSLFIASEHVVKELNDISFVNDRYNKILFDNRNVEIINGKNENAISYNQAMNYIRNKKGIKTIVFGFEYISKRYPYQDVSWLYDIDFEFITDVDKFVCVGPWKNDLATRLSLFLPEDKIITVDNYDNLNQILKTTKGSIYAVLNMGSEILFKKGIGE